METKKPEISLFSITRDPLESIAVAIDVWHNDIPNSPEPYKSGSLGSVEEKFNWLLKQPHQTPFEYVSTVWIIKNVSRAFQQQLTRHRIGFSYSIQSLRVIDLQKFAEEGRYTMPTSIKDKDSFHRMMLAAQANYNHLISVGEEIENARGLLPLNVHSTITMSCTYRSLLGLLKQRMCVATQEEWKAVVEGIRSELSKISPVLVAPMDCMCKRFSNGTGFCKTLHKPVTK